MHKLHVITRTSGRPNFFKICNQSITQQTYKNINHIVVVDDANTNPERSVQVPWHVGNGYINQYKNITKINISWNNISHFEQALNFALDEIPDEDYFCILDDDDFYTSPNSLQTAMSLVDNKDILFWRVYAAAGIVPDKSHFKKALPYGQIAMIGWIVKKSFIKNCRFNPMYGGDFDFIQQITGGNVLTPNIGWHDDILSATNPRQPQGEGSCRDISPNAGMIGFKSRSKGFNYDFM